MRGTTVAVVRSWPLCAAIQKWRAARRRYRTEFFQGDELVETRKKFGWLLTVALLAAGGVGAIALAGGAARAQQADWDTNSKPLPDPTQAETDALVKRLGLPESDKTVKELVPGWTKPKKLLVHIDRPDRIAWLQKVAPGVKLIGVYQKGTIAEREAEAIPLAGDVDGFVYVVPNILCDAKVIAAAKKLKWLHSYGAGVDDCIGVSPDVGSGKFLLTNSQKVRGRWIAENIFGMMVTLMRGVDLQARMDLGKKLVTPNYRGRGMLMEGRTLLVVGLGGIGTELAKMAHGIGMKVIATRNSNRNGPDFVDYVGLSDELPDLIGKADVVAMTAPLTPETKGMFDAAMFNRMKKGAIFVSISREDVVVKDDLIAALKSGQVGAAGMNANTGAPGERPPLAPNDPQWSAPNMFYMTHSAAPARTAEGVASDADLSWQITREEVRRYVAGEKMLSVVDVKRGY
jgi:phosphoglycerate dehydrogenase-like enzyme